MNEYPTGSNTGSCRIRTTQVGLAGVVIGMVLATTMACSSAPPHPGKLAELLPTGTVGAVSLGGLGVETSGGNTVVFVFDEHGTVLGRIEDGRIDANQVLFSQYNAVTATARSVTVLTARERSDIPIDEHTVVAMANNPDSGATTVWFMDGRSSTFVSIGADQQVRQGSIGGIVRTSAYCGDRHFVVLDDFPTGTGTPPSRFYELLPSGQLDMRGQWENDPDNMPASRTSVCAPDSQSVLTPYAHYTATGEPTMTLAALDLATGTRRVTPMDMPTVRGGALRGTLSVVDDRLYWLTPDKEVMSVPVAGSSTVTHEWTLPSNADTTIASVHGVTVTAIDHQNQPVMSRYDLRTGTPIGEPIPLLWLEPIIGSPAGDTTYALTSVAAAPHTVSITPGYP